MEEKLLVQNLSPVQIAATEAHNITQRIIFRQRAIRLSFLDQGRDLLSMCEFVEISPTEKLQRFQLLDYETFESYVSGELHFEIRTAYLYKSVVQRFIVELGVDDDSLSNIGIKKLGLLCHHVTESNVWEWLAKAGTLSHSDLLREIDETARGISGYNAEQRAAFETRLQINFDDPPQRIAQTTISFLMNELLRMHPDLAKTTDMKTAVRVLKRLQGID